MKNFKTFLNLLSEEPIPVCHECTEDKIILVHEVGNYELEFRLHYGVAVPYYLSGDTSNPEEYELEFENKEIDEIELTEDGEFIELSNKEINSIYKVLSNHLLK